MSEHRASPAHVVIVLVALLTCLVLLAQGAVGEAGAAKDDRPAKVTMGISTEKQRGLLKRGVLRVRVRTSSPTRVRVAASHAGRNGLFKPKTVRVEGRGRDAKKVRLPLTASGERKLSSCGAKLVKVTGEYRSGGKNRRSTATKNLRKDANLCRGPYPPVPVENADRCDFLDPARLPAAVPERLLHQERRVDRDGQAPEPEPGVDAGQRRGRADRPDRHEPRRRLQPRQPDHDQGPRGRDASRPSRTPASSRSTTCAPTTIPTRP